MYIKLHLSPHKATREASPNYLQRSERYLLNDNLMTSQNTTECLHHPASRTHRIRDAATAGCEHPWLGLTSTVGGTRLRQQQLPGDSLNRLQQAARADSLAFLADQHAATHSREVPFSVTSTAKSARLRGLFLRSCGGESKVSPSMEPLIFFARARREPRRGQVGRLAVLVLARHHEDSAFKGR